MAFLDTLIYGVRQVVDGSNVLLLQRTKLKFVGAGSVLDDAANAQTVVTLTGNTSLGADTNGYSNITGVPKDTSNPKVTAITYPVNALGTGSSQTVLTIPTVTGHTYTIRGVIGFANAVASAYGEFEINAYANNNVGTVTLQSNTTTQKANNASFVVAVAVSSTNIVVNCTDPGTGRRITGAVYVADRTF